MRMIAARFTFADAISAKRDQIEIETKQELERIFFPRGIRVENVLLSEIRETHDEEKQ
jgi:hypothetical protein